MYHMKTLYKTILVSVLLIVLAVTLLITLILNQPISPGPGPLNPRSLCIQIAYYSCSNGIWPPEKWDSPAIKIKPDANPTVSCSQLVNCTCQNKTASCS